MNRDLVVISWDGKSVPHACIGFDQEPRFRLVTFDYSGAAVAENRHPSAELLSRRTECKGQIFDEVARFVGDAGAGLDYIGLIDDDVMMRISDINHMLHIARALALDAFSPALSHDSYYSHPAMLRRENRVAHAAAWVEVMAPFYRAPLFLAASRHFRHSISAWGIDRFLMPMFQKTMRMEKVAVIDAVMAAHVRPVVSQARRYSNGLSASEEAARLRIWCMRHIARHQPDLVDSAWYKAIFVDL